MTGCNSWLRTLNDKDGLPTSELAPGCTIPQHREIYMSKFGEEIAAKKIMKDMRLQEINDALKCRFVFINTYMIYTYKCIPFLTVER